jgi:predicted nucleic acid-binding protein
VVVVSNSSPLIALARIQRLDLLPALFESILIPPAVSREIEPSIPSGITSNRTRSAFIATDDALTFVVNPHRAALSARLPFDRRDDFASAACDRR